MKVTVEMTAEEFELFRSFQKNKDEIVPSLEAKYSRCYTELRDRHESLCKAVLGGMAELDEPDGRIIAIVEKGRAAEAIEIAKEWYA